MGSFLNEVLEKITMKKGTKFHSSAIIRFKVIAVLGGVLVSKSQKCKSSHCSRSGTHELDRFMMYMALRARGETKTLRFIFAANRQE